MRTAIFAVLAASLATTACGNGEQSQDQQQASPIRIHTAAQEEVHKSSGLNRAIGFKNAIYDSGYKCRRITRTGYVGQYKNLEEWMASCADGRDWAVFVGPDGSAQVRDCKDVVEAGLPSCAMKSDVADAGPEPVAAKK
jgi:uncharacterized protein CbrC (UPF0167 family)